MANAKTFRLFISSPFNDFREERQVLHEKVFPKIDKYCNDKGYTFQPVDLRWGVSEEAQLDQKTLKLCLNEVKACKHYPHPNFLIMTGNRYGWVSLPYAIQKDEFESILEFYADNSVAISMLEKWYVEDTNHLMLNNSSHAYVLEKRDPNGEYKDWKEWEKEENKLRDILQTAAKELFEENTAQYNKYFMSATEAEVEEGILQYLNPTEFQQKLQTDLEKEQKNLPELDKDYVFGFLREITNIDSLDLSQEPAKLFIDKDQTKATVFKEQLIDALSKENTLESTVKLSTDIKKPFVDKKHLCEFEKFMIGKLTQAIDKQIDTKEVSALKQEQSEQLRFKILKTDTFFGREEELIQVQNYINNTCTQPFIVHGISGIGKSSFIAKAIDEVEEALTHTIVYRFIGATASSSNIRTLLELLITDLAEQDRLELPEKFEEDDDEFNVQIKALLETLMEPTVIILDALDQLQDKNHLKWLPLELPSNLKIILSMLDQKGYEYYYDLLKTNIDTANQLEIKPIDEDVAKEILDELLKKEKRSLTDAQYKYAIRKLKESNSSPLYLKIAFEEIKTWKQTDEKEELAIGIQKIIKEFIDNLTTKFHHDKAIVHKVLGLISASRDGLSESELLDLLSHDEDILSSLEKEENNNNLTLTIGGVKVRRFPISVWARLSEQLRPFVNERLIDGEKLITPFHRIIAETIEKEYYEDKKENLHKELAYYFDLENHLITQRSFNELPWALYKLDDFEELKKVILNHQIKALEENNELAWYTKKAYDKWDAATYIGDETYYEQQLRKLSSRNATYEEMDKRIYEFIVENFSNDSTIDSLYEYTKKLENSSKYMEFLIELAILVRFSMKNESFADIVKYITIYTCFELYEASFSYELNVLITDMFNAQENFPYGIYNNIFENSGVITKDYIAQLNKCFDNGKLNVSIFRDLYNKNSLDDYQKLTTHEMNQKANIKYGMRIENQNSQFLEAIKNENIDMLDSMIFEGTGMDISSEHLLEAIYAHSLSVVKFLIEASEEDIIHEYMNIKIDSYAEPKIPIVEAVKRRQLDIVKFLLINGAHSEIFDFLPEGSLFMFAILNKDLEMVKLLLKYGVDINQKTSWGHTPLEYALFCESPSIIEFLS
ncbi:ankyrin repeat domain-containing protein [Candidatus Sulfurimonas baltica]|uniref:DUF4062 domain-containing protein n=1 Tax=Candidatus Sulfurimonas baltica TaxID=2740404 RepID=A0A7S7LYK2_9BACT|nr:ankyrin repeat domain-containing protein [Candidatus Sulfurimonas baltica]QOY53238.1 DUF4062 domain-containing protein [Candidatus Sulfurimonas baltica]